MKVVKLDNRHNLKRKGYAWAFKFNRWNGDSSKVESAVRKFEGHRWDSTYWGKPRPGPDGFSIRPYYVGVKEESTVTMVLLSLK